MEGRVRASPGRGQPENHVFDLEPEDDLLELLLARVPGLTITLKRLLPFKIIVKEVIGSSVHALAWFNTDQRSILSISVFKQRHLLGSSSRTAFVWGGR